MRRLNLGFAAFLLADMTVLAGAVHLAHDFQTRRQAPALLERARRAEADGDLGKAQEALALYLNLRREDGPAWAWYARLVDRRDPDGLRRGRVYLIRAEALRHNPGDAALERQCAELALELGRYGDALSYLTGLLNRLGKDARGRAASELEELLGRCLRGQSRYDEAAHAFRRAIERDPARSSCYAHLARLLRVDLRRDEEADAAIRAMVERNPESALAYIGRWRYAQEFAPPGDPGDVRRALELGPDNPEVRIAAAIASEQGQDPAGARAHWEKGWALDPGNTSLAVGLARLEVREGHLDRAEAVLRRADHVHSSIGLAFELAEVLIFQGKIEGNDQAEGYNARLRDAGFGETLVRFLEAELLVQKQRWAEAIARIERDRAVLRSFPRLAARLDLMLADGYGRMGADELRLDALRRAAEDDRGPESARIELARGLSASGQADRAIGIVATAAARSPERRLDLIRLLIERTSRLPADRRDWHEVESKLRAAERALPGAAGPLTLLQAAMLVARDRPDQARSLLAAAQARDPRDLRYRLALARLARRQGQDADAMRMLDQAEKDLGPGLELKLARLDDWGLRGGDEAIAAVARLAAGAAAIPAPDRQAFLDRLAAVETGLGRPAQAREHLRQLSELRPDDVRVLSRRLDLAVQAGDHADALALAARLREVEGERGTLWRFGRASVLLDRARRGAARDLDAPRALAAEIAALRPEWWGSAVLLAELAELAGRTDEAIKSYTRAVELGNNDPSLARRLAGLVDQKGETGLLDRVAGILSNRGESAADVTIAAALGAIRRGDYDRGITLARRAFPETSTHFADHLMLGRFYQAARRTEEAGRELRRAVELGPGVPATWLRYVQHLVETRQLDRARAAVDAACKALPADRAGIALARCAAMVGDTARAEAGLRTALDSPACDIATIRSAVDLLVDQGRFDRVEPLLERLEQPAMRAAPEVLAWANRTRSLARLSTGRAAEMDRALSALERNLKDDPTSPEDLKLKGIILALRPGRRADAIALLEPLERSGRLGPGDRFILAQACLTEGLSDRYRGLMGKLLEDEPNDVRYLGHFLAYLIDRGELDEAGRRAAEAIGKGGPAAGLLRPKLAAIYCRQGRYDEAEALFRSVLRTDPGNIEALNNLAWELALREPGEPREALALIDRAIQRGGRMSTLVDTRAVALIRSGDPERAARELDGARTADPRNASLAIHLAWAYQSAGKTDEARRALRHAEELGLRLEGRHPLERGFIARLRSQLTPEPGSANRG